MDGEGLDGTSSDATRKHALAAVPLGQLAQRLAPRGEARTLQLRDKERRCKREDGLLVGAPHTSDLGAQEADAANRVAVLDERQCERGAVHEPVRSDRAPARRDPLARAARAFSP